MGAALERLPLEGAESAHKRMGRRLPAVAVEADANFIGIARAGRSLEVGPGGPLSLESFLDGVFMLFSEWMHLVEADPPRP